MIKGVVTVYGKKKFLGFSSLKQVIFFAGILGLLISGYRIFFTDNYYLFWSYIVFVASSMAVTYSAIYRRGERSYKPFTKRLTENPLIFLLPVFALLVYSGTSNYFASYSPVTIESGSYELSDETGYWICSEDADVEVRKSSIDFEPAFEETLLVDLAKIEGKSIGFIRSLNHSKIKAREGSPVEIFTVLANSDNNQSGFIPYGRDFPVIIKVYPNGTAFVNALTSNGYREFYLELSDETFSHFKQILK